MTDFARITRSRLASQFLTTRGPRRATGVVGALLAVQAQDYPGAKWALGQRTPGATDRDIEHEIDEGRILRTHLMRPTWHFVLPGDIRWLLTLTGPRVSQQMASYNRKFGLTPAVVRRANDAIARAVEGGRHRTRAELRDVLARARVGSLDPQRLGHIMLQAELDQVVCSGPRRGKQFTYALLDERAPAVTSRGRDEMLGEIATRYFATRGPATLRDFAWWSGLTMKDARRGIDIAGRALRAVTIADEPMWMGRLQPRAVARPSAHLLPNYDEYFIGFKDRSAAGQRLRSVAAVTGGSALIGHVAFVDGQLVGGWKAAVSDGVLRVLLTPFARITAAERERLAAQARRLGAFHETEAELLVR